MKKATLLLIAFMFFLSCKEENNNYYLYDFSFGKSSKKASILITAKDIYTSESEYGYDLNTVQGDKKPFYFSVKLPEGNYLVHLTLGSAEKESVTTVKSESRRLMLENIKTQKGEHQTHSISVNIRTPKVGENDSVRIKPREVGKLTWDDKLTLEFNGENPTVTRIQIEEAYDLPTLFLAGNSTVVDQSNEPWCGWGQMLPRFLKSNIVVANYAESGEAANSFISAKRFAKMLTQMKKGDYLFIEFGHNDQKQKGKGPFTSYKQSLNYLVKETRKHGATPILVTPMHRRKFDERGKVINTLEEYPNAVRELATEENVALIDLNKMSEILYEAWGEEGSKKAFVHYPADTFPNQESDLADNTHFNSYGGYEIAKCILKGIMDANIPLRRFFVDDHFDFDPANPDPVDAFSIPASPFYSMIKLDGN